MTSDLVNYYPSSPYEDQPVCKVSGEPGDGVVFANLLDEYGMPPFIGRQAILEATSLLTGFSVKQLKGLEKVKDENKELRAEVARLREETAEFDKFKARMESAGLAYRELE